tara:strand:+ start:4846 stop:5493 length:648 start_codon:yes stop_codon:yes gene_type:complete
MKDNKVIINTDMGRRVVKKSAGKSWTTMSTTEKVRMDDENIRAIAVERAEADRIAERVWNDKVRKAAETGMVDPKDVPVIGAPPSPPSPDWMHVDVSSTGTGSTALGDAVSSAASAWMAEVRDGALGVITPTPPLASPTVPEFVIWQPRAGTKRIFKVDEYVGLSDTFRLSSMIEDGIPCYSAATDECKMLTTKELKAAKRMYKKLNDVVDTISK